MKTYYYLYKITNMINDKIYIGVHKTKNLDDGYMGSGKLLKRSIVKYGVKNFKKDILQHFDSSDDMFNAESEIVNEEFTSSVDTYNINLGGHGGWDHIIRDPVHMQRMDEIGKLGQEALKLHIKNDPEFAEFMETARRSNLVKASKVSHEKNPKGQFYGKNHTEACKRKIGEANSKHQLGAGNSQYGTKWIYNLELKESKRINKTEDIPNGWILGRKIKW